MSAAVKAAGGDIPQAKGSKVSLAVLLLLHSLQLLPGLKDVTHGRCRPLLYIVDSLRYL